MTLSVARKLGRWVAAAALLGAVVLTYTRLLHVNPTTAALTLLLVVLWLAANWGLSLAIAASLAAALCFNYYFLPPVNTFSIADTQNWVALAAFLATALIASNLADRLQAARTGSEARRSETELLYNFSQQLLTFESTTAMLDALPGVIANAFGCTEVALFLADGEQLYSTPPGLSPGAEVLAQASVATHSYAGQSAGSVLVPLAVGVRRVGAIYLAGLRRSPAAALPSAETLEAMSSLVALSLERAAALGKLVRAEAAAESDRLRATLLDAVAHELRTPLTSIKAAVTALLSQGALRAEQKGELLTVIDEESDRLDRLIAQAIEMAELDAKAVRLQRGPLRLDLLAREAVEQACLRWPGRAFLCADPRNPAAAQHTHAEDFLAFADARLLRKVLEHLLDNGAKYATPATPITVTVSGTSRWLEVAVADEGPGVPPAEQERIFDKFYRSPAHQYRAPGTGMGLPIARAMVEAHGGRLTLESAPGQGSCFCFTVPRAEASWS